MRQWISNVWYLGGKEIRSFFTDYALFALLVFMFTFPCIPCRKTSPPK